MRILVADAFPESCLAALNHDCAYEPDTAADQLASRMPGHDVLVVRSTPVTAEVFERAPTLRMVIRAGSGTNTIDREAASRHGVHVCNVPGRNADAVAELALALLLTLDRDIVDATIDLRAGRWRKKRYSHSRGIRGRRVGIIGLGSIGFAFAERAAAFGVHLYAVTKQDRSQETLKRAHSLEMTFVDDLDTLAETCDVLSLHVPATDATRHLINRSLLSRVPEGTIILNTARGELVDEDALIEAMETNGVRAGLDVFENEPASGEGQIRSRLAGHPNVCGSHHVGASTEQAQDAVAAEVVRMIDAFHAGTVLHCVNPDSIPAQRDQVASALHHGAS